MTSNGAKSFHLRWNNHLTNLRSLLEALYTDQNLVDVTLSCSDGTLRAHKLMLSACSPYFETIFTSHEGEHPVVILKGISRKEMKCLIDYMYVGSLEVSEEELPSLLAVANELQIKGLIQKPNASPEHSSPPPGSSSPNTLLTTSHTANTSSSPCRSSSDPEDEDVEMEERHAGVEVAPPTSITASEQTFRSVTQYGGGMVNPGETTDPANPSEDKANHHDSDHITIAPDGEVIDPLHNHNNNNNGQMKSSSQSQYIGHCLDESYTHPDLQCRICKRYFNNRQNLRRHVQTHTGDKPHQCDICFISFLRLSHLQRHIRTHTGEKPYSCSLCAKSFSRSDKLKNHYIHQHSEVGAELTNKKRGRPSKVSFPGLNFALSSNTLTVNSSSGQNENRSPPHLPQPSLFFNSGALSLTPVSMSGNTGSNEALSLISGNAGSNFSNEALSLIVNKSLQNQAYQHIANAISDNVLSIAPIKMESSVKEQTVS